MLILKSNSMPLSPTKKFTLRNLESEGQPLATLAWSGSLSVEVNGATLEGQFQTESGNYFLVLTDDCPFEETVRCYLLSKENAVIDQLEFAVPYQSLIIQEIEIVGDQSLCLLCSGNTKLKIDISEIRGSVIKRLFSRIEHSKNGLITLTETEKSQN